MNWTDVKNRFETELGPSRSEQSDKRSLLVLARYSERHGMNPDLYMAPGSMPCVPSFQPCATPPWTTTSPRWKNC